MNLKGIVEGKNRKKWVRDFIKKSFSTLSENVLKEKEEMNCFKKKKTEIDGNSQMEREDKNERTERAVNVMSSSMIESVRTINHFLMKAKLRTTKEQHYYVVIS